MNENTALLATGSQLEVNEQFSLEKKAQADGSDPRVQEWEQLAGEFQSRSPQAKPKEK